MTNEQINAAIAEACGWTQIKQERNGKFTGKKPYENSSTHIGFYVPDYCADLNAMHEAEKVLTKKQVREYQTYMYDMACEIDNTYGRWMPYSATAAYRAEAFLRTLGKWEEAQ